MFPFIGAIIAAALTAEACFEIRIAHMPEDAKARLRVRRREWQEVLQRQAEDSSRACQGDPSPAFLFGLALGVGLA